jgi:hypothetical protein
MFKTKLKNGLENRIQRSYDTGLVFIAETGNGCGLTTTAITTHRGNRRCTKIEDGCRECWFCVL